MHDNQVLARIAALQTMPVKQIKQLWNELYEQPAPEFNRNYLVSRLTYRLQELAFGSDEHALVEKRMEAMAKKIRFQDIGKRKPQIHRPMTGTRIVREYQGAEYRVDVEQDGFVFNGRKYRSLSRIAFLITGSAWSGPAFFGLTAKKAAT